MKLSNLLLLTIFTLGKFINAAPFPPELGGKSANNLLIVRTPGSQKGDSSDSIGASSSTTIPPAEKNSKTKKRPATEPAGNEPATKKPATKEPTADNQGASGEIPPFKTISLAAEATSYHFYTGGESKQDPLVIEKQANAILNKMNGDGQFTAVVMRKAKTSIVGEAEGTTTPRKYLLSQGQSSENYLITNGGFFIHKLDPFLMDDFKGKPLDSKSILHQSVGQTSISKKFVAIPKVYSDLFMKLEGDDKSFLWSGPNLRNPLDERMPVGEDVNSKAWRLHYFFRDRMGNKVPNPNKADEERFVTTPFMHLPGRGICTSNERNERNALVYVDGIKIAFAYTSRRNVGMTLNHLRELIDQFLKTYLKTDITHSQMALNLDGGASTFLGWMNEGKLSVLAAGELGGPKAVPFAPEALKFREVTTMVKHVLA